MPGADDLWPWLQSILANQGAGQPTSIAGTPRYGTGPGNLGMGDPRGLTGMPGPSMGYPAMGPLGAQAAPQPPAPDPLGFSVGVNPHGDGPPDVMSPAAMYQAQYGGPTAAADAAHALPSAPFVQPQHPSTMRYPMWPTPPAPADAPAGSPSATPKPADSGAKGPLASSGQGGIGSDARFPLKRRAGAPNLGYYQPTTGNARGATWTPYANPNDPRIYRG